MSEHLNDTPTRQPTLQEQRVVGANGAPEQHPSKRLPALWSEHAAVLTARAIPVEFAVAHGLVSIDVGAVKASCKKYNSPPPFPHLPLHEGATGVLLPYQICLDDVPRARIRVDRTEVTLPGPVDGSHHGERTVSVPRYVCQAKPVTVVPYIPPEVFRVAGDVSIPIYIAEALLKALSLTANIGPAIGLGGVLAGATDTQVLDALGELVLCKEMQRIQWTGRLVYVVFDAGMQDNAMVALGAARVALALRHAGADVRLVNVPYAHPTETDAEAGKIIFPTDQGPDDFIARNGVPAFQRLVDAAVPADPVVRAFQASVGPNRTEAVAHLLGELPVQAMLHEGGALIIDQVAAVMKVAQVSKKAVQQAAQEFATRLVRRAEAADVGTWKTKLRRSSTGKVESTADNILTILANDPEWSGVLGFNEFSQRVVLRKEAPWDDDDAPKGSYRPDQEVSDADDFRFVSWLGRRFRMRVPTQMAHDAICTAAERTRFHPVREYLRKIVWDKVPRLGSNDAKGWLSTYVGVEDKPYARLVGRMWPISAVARIFRPGCLVKTMLVLCGPQDAKKSQTFSTLGGDWYMDDLRDIHSKDACQQLAGKWIVEMGEMAAWGKADAETGKRFISTRVDNYRPAYGRNARDFERQSVFGGTTNVGSFIGDPTGGSRFWPVDVGRIDIEALKRDRDQIWAEAVAAFDAGETWWTEDAADVTALRVEQEDRRKGDPWEAVIDAGLAAGWTETSDDNHDIVRIPRSEVNETTMEHVLGTIIGIPVAQQTQAHQMRVGACMTALGWIRVRRREGGSRVYFYVRTGVAEPPAPDVGGAEASVPGEAVPMSPPVPPNFQVDLGASATFSTAPSPPNVIPGGDSRDSGDSSQIRLRDGVPTSGPSADEGGTGGDSSTAPAPAVTRRLESWTVTGIRHYDDGQVVLELSSDLGRAGWTYDPTRSVPEGARIDGDLIRAAGGTLYVIPSQDAAM